MGVRYTLRKICEIKTFTEAVFNVITLAVLRRPYPPAKTKYLPGILNCRHFEAVCFYGNVMAPIPSRAEITQETWIMRSHFAAVSPDTRSEEHAQSDVNISRLESFKKGKEKLIAKGKRHIY